VGMSAASDEPLKAAARLSVVSTIGYTAFLVGPGVLGLLADHVGTRNALLAILVPLVVGLLVIPAARPPQVAAQDGAPTGPTAEPASRRVAGHEDRCRAGHRGRPAGCACHPARRRAGRPPGGGPPPGGPGRHA